MLFLTARFPLPLDTGAKIRTFHLLSAAARHHDVVLLSPVTDHERTMIPALLERLPNITLDAVTVPDPRQSVPTLTLAGLRNFVEPLPLTWMRYQWPAVGSRLAEHAGAEEFDLLHCDHVHIAPLLGTCPIRPRLVDAHNVESILMGRVARTERRPWLRLLLRWQAAKAAVGERQVYRQADRVLACSTIDRQHLRLLAPSAPVTIVPNGVDVGYFSPSDTPEQAATVAFSGSMDWAPNIDAVRYFARDILPRVRARYPAIRLVVVGRNPSPTIVPPGTPGVDVTGTVSDIRPHLAAASAVVVPLRSGGGTRLKILEAWAMRKAVISTSVGAEGLRAENDWNILLADTPAAFAARIDQVLRDPGLRHRIAERGYRTALEFYDWARVGERLLEAYDQTVVKTAASEPGRLR